MHRLHNYLIILSCISAVQMWCLMRFLPIMIGDIIPDDIQAWQCFQMLWNITSICSAREISDEQISYLKVLVAEHHELFKVVYPNCSIIPKLHYLVHVPELITRLVK